MAKSPPPAHPAKVRMLGRVLGRDLADGASSPRGGGGDDEALQARVIALTAEVKELLRERWVEPAGQVERAWKEELQRAEATAAGLREEVVRGAARIAELEAGTATLPSSSSDPPPLGAI